MARISSSSVTKEIKKICSNLNINTEIWCLKLTTKFEAGYCRLKIFEYTHINKFDKILYLDCDILVTNNLKNIFDITLENKLYVLKEGNTNHVFWGKEFFQENNPNSVAFTSGILLFNNCSCIKKLFQNILKHINEHLIQCKEIPLCLDQPFIVYHSFLNDLYTVCCKCSFM